MRKLLQSTMRLNKSDNIVSSPMLPWSSDVHFAIKTNLLQTSLMLCSFKPLVLYLHAHNSNRAFSNSTSLWRSTKTKWFSFSTSVYLCLHDAYDALMACYEKAASEYDEVNEIRQYYFQSAASLILRRSFRDRDEFAPTLITTYVVQFLAFSSILACAQRI